MNPAQEVARVRLDNAMRLFDEFVQATIKAPDAATLRGLERRFAERLQIQPSYWSQIKSRSRQIGERLARQFEQLCRKPVGWMDLPQTGTEPARTWAAGAAPASTAPASAAAWPAGPQGADTANAANAAAAAAAAPPSQPQDDDERFIVGLVLSYYRRHPQRARTRLLDLLGEVLTPQPDPAAGAQPRAASALSSPRQRAAPRPAAPAPSPADDLAVWVRTQSGIAPLKRKR